MATIGPFSSVLARAAIHSGSAPNAANTAPKLAANSPNSSVSYYQKGQLVGWLMDAALREGSRGKADLWSVDLTGVNERRVPTPLDGSACAAWSSPRRVPRTGINRRR